LVVFGLMTYLIRNNKEPGEILKAFGIPLIILSAVFVVISGFSPNQLSPVMGLLGTIAGYLLGRAEKGGAGQKEEATAAQAATPKPVAERAELVKG
ncbi:MAG TPA: hypothetical protein VNT26_20930, partial [Candidatus Sulfotelmatobacter sp.]|nr:hypothetical protein [Candidatus Sulfotelmatobacter sp.]